MSKTFRSVFWLALRIDPAAAIRGLGWVIRGKRVRGWNRLCVVAAKNPLCFSTWARVAEHRQIENFCAGEVGVDPRYQCVIIDENLVNSEDVRATVESVSRAFGDDVVIWSGTQIAGTRPYDQEAGLARLIAMLSETAATEWLLPIRAGDVLSPSTGEILRHAQAHQPDAEILYWDEDVRRGSGRALPWIKPDWDTLLFLARDVLMGACIVRLAAAAVSKDAQSDASLPGAGIAATLSAIVETPGASTPVHIPFILTHRSPPLPDPNLTSGLDEIAMHGAGRVRATQGDRWAWRNVVPADPADWPAVSIIIPTRDRHTLLEMCIDSVRRITYAGAVEILIVDNDSTDAATHALFKRYRESGLARVVSAPGDFNFSRLNNLAAKEANGSMLCLLNNDIEALDGEWLSAMVRHAVREEVGAVGAQLLYPDGSVQHAGVVIGIGGAAGHFGKGARPDDDHYGSWIGVTRCVSAVTAACLVVRRDLYMAVGGFDEDNFAVAFNDVDFCLRLDQHGYRNVYVAQARLVHHESQSRGLDDTPQKSARFLQELGALRQRWNTDTYRDARFSPLFSRTSEACVLEFQA
ncbi:glycosyltransferase family 2 protein [Sphingomonas panacis]|uniref:glycosyltransferase family 2 protein n=1 Tax=Sphingomonas panacis TaxID=1560345 RepID=UPI00147255EF|nr:glycosyltransferase family 2 protein [Sphingomonas panacis]